MSDGMMRVWMSLFGRCVMGRFNGWLYCLYVAALRVCCVCMSDGVMRVWMVVLDAACDGTLEWMALQPVSGCSACVLYVHVIGTVPLL